MADAGGNDMVDFGEKVALGENPFGSMIVQHIVKDAVDLRRGFYIREEKHAPTVNIFEGLPMSINTFLSRLTVILGTTGCGKSNTVAVLAEELLDNGVSISIIDVEGEHWTLKRRYPWLRLIGNSRSAEVKIPTDDNEAEKFAEDLAKQVIHNLDSVIVDFSRTSDYVRAKFIAKYFDTVFDECESLFYDGNQTVHILFVEEAHNFIPLRIYSANPDIARMVGNLKAITRNIATQGRKRGVGVVLATQRNQEIDRTITAMANVRIMHRSTEVNDMKLYADLYGEPFGWVKMVAPTLPTGTVFLRTVGVRGIYKVRLRHTYHAAYTPSYTDVEKWAGILRQRRLSGWLDSKR